MLRTRCLSFLLPLGLVLGLAPAGAQSLYPPLDQPALRFESEGHALPGRPDLAGPLSPWRVAQFNKSELLVPDQLRPGGAAMRSALYGLPLAAEATGDGSSALAIYRSGAGRTGPGLVFRLLSRGGVRVANGSSNLFLTASPLHGPTRFDHEITYDLDARLARARIIASAAAIASGAVLAHVFTGFTLALHNVPGSPKYDVFLQITHAQSRPEPSGYFQCSVHPGGQAYTIGWGGSLPGADRLAFQPSPDPPKPLHYVLNDFLCHLLRHPPRCGNGPLLFAGPAADPANWTLGGIYFGLETHVRPAGAGPQNSGPAGAGPQNSGPAGAGPQYSGPAGAGTAAAGQVAVALDVIRPEIRRTARPAPPCR